MMTTLGGSPTSGVICWTVADSAPTENGMLNASAKAQTRTRRLLGILLSFRGRSSGPITVPKGFRPVPGPASVHEVDPQAVEALPVSLQQVEEDPLLNLVASEQRSERARLVQGPSGLCEGLADDPPGIGGHPFGCTRILSHQTGDLVKSERLLLIALG